MKTEEITKIYTELGVYYSNIITVFFKIIKKPDEVDEDLITHKLRNNFSIAKKVWKMDFEGKILLLYEYIDAIHLNAYNYLRSSKYTLADKSVKLYSFFNQLFDLIQFYEKESILDGSCKSDVFFQKRFGTGTRSQDYYGINFSLLKADIMLMYPEFYPNFLIMLKNIIELLECKSPTLLTYCHGDFHDFNFSLDNIFWDVDTFSYNPIINDFTIYYWHFYAREDYLILKYNPWLSIYMYNQLSLNELMNIRLLKKNIITNWLSLILESFKTHGLTSEHFIKEFLFKLFCRVFLVDNVIKFDTHDKIIIYKYFNTLITTINEDILASLFISKDDVGLIPSNGL